MSWIDIIFIAILIIFAVIGIIKGLLESILSLVSTGVAFGLAIWIGKPAAKFLRSIVNVDGWFEKLLAKSTQDSISVVGINITREQLAKFLTVVLCVVVVFILIKLIVFLLAKLFDNALQNNSGFSGLNRVLGMLFGACRGIFLIACGLAICSIITWIPGVGSKVKTAIDNTKITSLVYKYVDNYVQDKISEEKLKEIVGVEDLTITEVTIPEDSSLANIYVNIPGTVLYGENATITLTFSDNSTIDLTNLTSCNFSQPDGTEGLDVSSATTEPRTATVSWNTYTFEISYVVSEAPAATE